MQVPAFSSVSGSGKGFIGCWLKSPGHVLIHQTRFASPKPFQTSLNLSTQSIFRSYQTVFYFAVQIDTRSIFPANFLLKGRDLEETCPVVSCSQSLLELTRENCMSCAWHKASSRGSGRHLRLVTSACLRRSHSFLTPKCSTTSCFPLHRCSTWRPNLAFQNRIRELPSTVGNPPMDS